MTSIPLALTDWSLLLAVPSAWLACGIVPLALIIWLNRYEMHLVSRRMAAALLGLRITVLLVILFLLGFQPIVARDVKEELRGQVLIAVDRSDTMEIADPQRRALDKLRTARRPDLV